METRCRKEYVSVNLDVDKEGVYHPRFIRWEAGRIFQIEKLTYKCRASSKEVLVAQLLGMLTMPMRGLAVALKQIAEKNAQ